jgi:hypothetical protein
VKIWDCKIGEVDAIGSGMDLPMRAAVAKAYHEITGEEPDFIFSGWGGQLTEPERAVVENREPRDEARLVMACDCGHDGLDAMFHLAPCPVAELRAAARRLGYDLALIPREDAP